MSSGALAEVLDTPHLSDSYFRLFVHLADCDGGGHIESSIDWLGRRARMPLNEVRDRLIAAGARWPDYFQIEEKAELVLEGVVDWTAIKEWRP